MRAVLYIGHGSRSKKGANEARSFFQRVKKRIDVPIQELSFLELADPIIEEGFNRCVGKGASEITVIPLFLLAAGHIKHDIPRILESVCKRYPHIKVTVENPYGTDERIIDGLTEMVQSNPAGFNLKDSLLIVGRGSSDQAIHRDFAKIAKGIQSRLGTEHISVCYLAAAEPKLTEGLEKISEKAANRVIVIPYLLFPGVLLNEVSQMVQKRKSQGQQIIHTGPLSEHTVFEDILIQRVTKREAEYAAAHN